LAGIRTYDLRCLTASVNYVLIKEAVMIEVIMIMSLMSNEVPYENMFKFHQVITKPARVIELSHEQKIQNVFNDFRAQQIIAQSA